MNSVGQRIKKRRKELGISAEELAKRLNKNRATIYRYESDEIENMPITVLEPLSKALLTTPAYLMGWKNDSTFSENLKYLINKESSDLETLSKELDISLEELNSFILDTADPTMCQLKKIANHFHKQNIDMLNTPLYKEYKVLKNIAFLNIEKLNDQGIKKVQEYIDDLVMNDKYKKES